MSVMSPTPKKNTAKAEKTEKLQGRSVPELMDDLEDARRVLIRVPYEMEHKGQKMGTAPFINAILAHFLTLGADEQYAIASEGMKLFEAMEDRAAIARAGTIEALGSIGGEEDVDGARKGPKRRSAGR